MTGGTIVTRVEIAEALEAAFEGGTADRTRLMSAAIANGARTEVVDTLSSLSVGPFRHLRDLWEDLADVPVGA